jgi:hypothetical protein
MRPSNGTQGEPHRCGACEHVPLSLEVRTPVFETSVWKLERMLSKPFKVHFEPGLHWPLWWNDVTQHAIQSEQSTYSRFADAEVLGGAAVGGTSLRLVMIDDSAAKVGR